MDRDLLIFLAVFLSIVVLLLSLVMPKWDRKRFLFVGFGVIAYFGLMPLAMWVVFALFKDFPKSVAILIGFLAYNLVMVGFGQFVGHHVKKSDEDMQKALDEEFGFSEGKTMHGTKSGSDS